jgi:hypothetical protein
LVGWWIGKKLKNLIEVKFKLKKHACARTVRKAARAGAKNFDWLRALRTGPV